MLNSAEYHFYESEYHTKAGLSALHITAGKYRQMFQLFLDLHAVLCFYNTVKKRSVPEHVLLRSDRLRTV